MILCNNKDKEVLLDFLKKSPSENCFFIGDIENFSFEEDFIDMWRIEKEGSITSLLLKYFNYYLISSIDSSDLKVICDKIKTDPKAITVSAVDSVIESIKPYFNFKNVKKTALAELSNKNFNYIEPVITPQNAKIEDLNDIFEFLKTIDEFDVDEKSRESFGQEVKTNTGRMCFIKDKGKVVSTAAITAENSLNGTIVGVATDANYRNRGYAMSSVTNLCKGMIENNKKVILFYNNPDAGKLYKKIGFKDVGSWSMGAIL